MKKTKMDVVKEHLWGPLGSVVLHVIIVILLFKFVQFIQDVKEPEVEVVMMEPTDIDLDELIEEEEVEELEDLENIEEITMTDEPISMETETAESVESSETSVDLESLDVLSNIDSPVVMKGLMSGRMGANRGAMLGKYAGKYGGLTEAAVKRALEWLRKNQNPDGSWHTGHKIGHTGLGLLTFLAHGETPDSKRYGPTVEKAIKYLLSQMDSKGLFKVAGGHSGVYEHCIGTYAIAEAFGMTRVPTLKDAMTTNLQQIIDGQQKSGGWDYSWKDEGRTDTSVMGWAAQAMKAGYIAGAKNEGLKGALDKSIPGFKMMQKESTGKFGYSSPGTGDIGMTGVGVLCMQLLGAAKDPSTVKGLNALKPVGAAYSGQSKHPLYAYYYVTQAKFHEGGDTWTSWNPKIATLLVKSQNKDGSWLPKEIEKRGKVYCTTLAALTLQVYYRFLPTFQTDAVKSAAPPEVAAEEDEVNLMFDDG